MRKKSEQASIACLPAAVIACVGLLLAGVVLANTTHAQRRQSVPSQGYFVAFQTHFDGDYRESLRDFQTAGRSRVRSTMGHWVDSICYHTMVGECYYQMGQPGRALEQYEMALRVFVANSNWLMRVRFPAVVGPSNSRVRGTITWGTSSRPSVLGHFPDTLPTLQGRLDNERVLEQGGIVSNPQLIPVHVHEIIRCTTLAIRRRLELLGPTCQHTILSAELMGALATRPGPVNHWSSAWVRVQLGLARASAGRMDEAIAELLPAVLVSGQFDHPLTATAQLELGKIALQQDRLDDAAALFLNATVSAAEFEQPDLMEEAFRFGLTVHLIRNPQQFYAPLGPAAEWARRNRFQQLYASLLILAAENQAAVRQTRKAEAALEAARRAIGRRDMMAGRVGVRYQYQLAHVSFQKGNVKAGRAALGLVMGFQKTASRRLFRIAKTDQMVKSGAITPRTADLVYATVLREPTAKDWAVDPMDTLTVAMTPHLASLENWFQITWERNAPEPAVEIADQIRRHRFFATLPMGGRLLALRWVLEAPDAVLTKTARLERQDLLARYPEYAELSQQARAVRQTLSGTPIDTEDTSVVKRQAKLAAQLDQLSAAQEVLLRELAVRREPSEFVFPPRRTAREIQGALGAGQLALIYFSTERAVHAVMLSRDKYASWQIAGPSRLQRQVATLLRAMGHLDNNRPTTVESLRDTNWKTSAQLLLGQMIEKRQHGFWNKFSELIIVPDDFLWHLPFEALQIPAGDQTEALGSKVRIRYLPLASLIVPDDRGRRPLSRTAVAVGQLFPGDDSQVAADAFGSLQAALPTAAALPMPPPAPTGLLRCTWDRLVVLDDIDDLNRGPLDWCPARVDKGKPGGSLGRWMQLPWGGPDQVVLPGFATSAASALKRKDGADMFLALCGLMGSGTRTVLISRWRTGGQTSFDLVREFVQELPHSRAADAWNRSVQLARSTEINRAREPRVGRSPDQDPVTADSPFFWAGYLLVDSAAAPAEEAQPGQ